MIAPAVVTPVVKAGFRRWFNHPVVISQVGRGLQISPYPTLMSSSSSQVACIQCRQQKVRCMGRDESSEQCDRCRKRGLNCVVDEKFKRTVKRKAVESLEAEIEQLKAQLAAVGAGAGAAGGAGAALPASAGARNGLSGADGAGVGPLAKRAALPRPAMAPPRFEPPRHTTITPRASLIPVSSWTCTPKSSSPVHRETLTLDSATIELLFREYVLYYHRVLPVVEVQRGPEFVYDASAALFWTIMAIASRRRGADLPPGINFERLCEVQKQCLSEIAVSPVLGHGKSSEFNLPSLYAVQAFILCTLWPPPTSSINADMSWNTIGIALLTANRAGLHCPGHGKDFERIFKSNKNHRTNIREQLVTWLATNALSQAIANMFGYPSAANFHAHREYLFHNLDLPPRVRHMYEIQRNAHDIELSLGMVGQGSCTDLNASMISSLIRIHAARYDHIEAKFGHEMDSWTLFTLYAGRAQLFSYYLYGDIQEESVLLLYNSCLTLLNHVVLQPDEYIKFLPVVSILILWQTASVVAKLYFSRWSTNLDRASGERLYRLVIKKVALSSLLEHDLPYRAAEIMMQMWGTFRAMARTGNERLVSAKLTLSTRMSASAFFDSLWLMREATEIRSQAPTNLTKRTPEQNSLAANFSDETSDSARSSSPIDTRTGPPQPQEQSQPQLQAAPDLGHQSMHNLALASQLSPPHQYTHMGSQMSHNGTGGHNSVGGQLGQTGQMAPVGGVGPGSGASVGPMGPVGPVGPVGTHMGPQTRAPMHSMGPQVDSYEHQAPYQRAMPTPAQDPWGQGLPALNSVLSPDQTAGLAHKSPNSPVSPALSAMIDASWSDMGPEAASTIWRDVNSVMEDFGFGLSELPYISP